MGWYRTCQICGLEGKGGFFCDCENEVSNKIAAEIKNMTLIRRVALYGPYNIGHSYELYQGADKRVGVIHYRYLDGEYGYPVEYSPFDEKDFASLQIGDDGDRLEEIDVSLGPEKTMEGF